MTVEMGLSYDEGMETTDKRKSRAKEVEAAISDLSLAMRLALGTGCQNPESEGHAWDPATRISWWREGTVASSPKCSKCRSQWRARLVNMGWGDEAVRHVFQQLGAPITWGKTRETVSMGLEAILLRGGTYSDWKSYKESKNPPPIVEKKLIDTLIYVEGELTDEMKAHNKAVQETWDKTIALREEAADRGEDPLAIRMPDMKVFRAKGSE